MKRIANYVLAVASLVLFPWAFAHAQSGEQNSIDSIKVAQQGGVTNLKLTFRAPLSAPPVGFSVASPARIALDFVNTTNGLGKNTQLFNEGDLRSANIVQSDDKTRVVLNLNRAMAYETTVEGNSLLIALVPSAGKTWLEGGVDKQVEHFSQAQPKVAVNSIRDIAFRRGKDGEARIAVDMSDPSAGIDIRQQGQSLIVDFIKVSVPE